MIEALIRAANIVGVSPALLVALCSTETNLANVVRYNDGASSSYGICQVKLETARLIDRKADALLLMKPHYNALIAARYLQYQMGRYNDTWLAVAAYNSGSVKFNRRRELVNRNYVKKVQRNYGIRTISE